MPHSECAKRQSPGQDEQSASGEASDIALESLGPGSVTGVRSGSDTTTFGWANEETSGKETCHPTTDDGSAPGNVDAYPPTGPLGGRRSSHGYSTAWATNTKRGSSRLLRFLRCLSSEQSAVRSATQANFVGIFLLQGLGVRRQLAGSQTDSGWSKAV